MAINRRLLPIKLHYFFFMAAMGPVLPQLSVYGRQLGVPPEIMGSVTGLLPIMILISKPLFGFLVDIFRDYRKTIFMGLIFVMAASYALICVVPSRHLKHFNKTDVNICADVDLCSIAASKEVTEECNYRTITCSLEDHIEIKGKIHINNDSFFCLEVHNKTCNNHTIHCLEDYEINPTCLKASWHFWYFIILMSLGTIGFNIANSISDAICFDVIGEDFDYGKQRVWGTIGFGITALIAGYIVDAISGEEISYVPAFTVMSIFVLFDMVSCIKLKLPIIPKPQHFFKDISKLLRNVRTMIFIIFAILSGIVDSVLVYFLFWYLEDLAIETGTKNIKFLEGLIVACETLGGEVIFFSISGHIIRRFGHAYSLSMGFMFYALRLALISLSPSPWYIVPIEFALQGPTYALVYTTIVAYANEIAPPGMSATMQGIAAGVDDGLGYAIGSVFGGFLYKYVGKAATLQIFASLALVCSIVIFIIHRTMVMTSNNNVNENIVYSSPNKAGATVETAE